MFELNAVVKRFLKRFTILDCVLLSGFSITYFATRLFRLFALPVFSDEGIYVNWAKIAAFSPSDRLISLTDGKQPLQTFITLPFVRFFQDDLLLAGRLAAILGGFLALLGIIILVRTLFGIKASYFAAIFYIFTPMFMLYDRMALVESTLNATLIWSLLGIIILGRTHRLDVALLTGMIFGVALLAKSSAIMYLLLFGAGFLFSRKRLFLRRWKFFHKQNILYIVNYLFLFFVAIVLGFMISQIQRFSPHYYMIAQKNLTFILSLSEFIQDPFHLIAVNWYLIPYYLFFETNFILPIMAVCGFVLLLQKEKYYALFFTTILFIPYLVIGSFNKVLFPRYLIFFPSIFVILASYFVTQLIHNKQKKILSLVLITFLLVSGWSFWGFYFQPKHIILPSIDKGQYVNGATAVWGAQEIMQLAQNESEKNKVIILAEGNFGLVADALRAYEKKSRLNVHIQGLWPLNISDLIQYQPELNEKKVWIVFSHRNEFSTDWPMKLIKEYTKPNGTEKLYLFELLPSGQFPDRKDLPQ